MLGRTQNKVEHGRQRVVEEGRRRIQRGELEKVPTWMAESEFLTNFCMFNCE